MIVPATEARIALSTAGSREEAERIAHTLVEERLAACVSLLPGATSVYRWRDEIESADEVLLLIKTSAENLERLEAALCETHSYEVPEFLVIHPEAASKPYLEWLVRCVTPKAADPPHNPAPE